MTEKRVLTLWNNEGVNENDATLLRKKSKELTVPLDKEARAELQALIRYKQAIITLQKAMYTLLEAVRLIGLLITPFMPDTGAKIAVILGQAAKGSTAWGGLQAGTAVAKAEPLFPRIEVE